VHRQVARIVVLQIVGDSRCARVRLKGIEANSGVRCGGHVSTSASATRQGGVVRVVAQPIVLVCCSPPCSARQHEAQQGVPQGQRSRPEPGRQALPASARAAAAAA